MDDLTDVAIVVAVLEDSNVVPKTSLEMGVENIDAVLEPGPTQNALVQGLIADIAASLGIDPSLVQISGLRRATNTDSTDSGRRRSQFGTSNLAFDVVISGLAAGQSVMNLVQQINDPRERFRTATTAF